MAHKKVPFKRSKLALDKQILAMQKLCPNYKVFWKKNAVTWTGTMKPTEMSETYTVQITYSLDMPQPEVIILSPKLKKREDEKIPHVYPGTKLCLFRPRKKEWTKEMLIAETTVPWISLWLYYYEMWHATGQWLGGGEHFEPKKKGGKSLKKVLSIDGGGIKGVFPASFLAALEETIGENIGDYFDLIVGTSTGGIIALGLASGMSAKEILAFYESEGPTIFKGNQFLKKLRWLSAAKYSQEPLDEALRKYFGEKRIGECKTRVMIPSLNLDTGEVHIYKTAHHEKFKNDYKKTIVEAARATSAAPTFFPSMISESGTSLVDGGMWANNPVGPAVVEAIGVLGWEKGDFQVLSIGCTSEPFSVDWGRKLSMGASYWGLKSVETFMSGQSSQSLGTAKILAGSKNVHRYDVVVPKKRFKLDGITGIQSLKGLGETEARKAVNDIEDIFFAKKAEPFIPFYYLTAKAI
jgi:uncharacterized protein